MGSAVPPDLTEKGDESEKEEKEEKNCGKGDLRCAWIRFERGTVPPNSGEATPGKKICDRKHVHHDVSERSHCSLKSQARGEGSAKISNLKGKTSILLHFWETTNNGRWGCQANPTQK